MIFQSTRYTFRFQCQWFVGECFYITPHKVPPLYLAITMVTFFKLCHDVWVQLKMSPPSFRSCWPLAFWGAALKIAIRFHVHGVLCQLREKCEMTISCSNVDGHLRNGTIK